MIIVAAGIGLILAFAALVTIPVLFGIGPEPVQA